MARASISHLADSSLCLEHHIRCAFCSSVHLNIFPKPHAPVLQLRIHNSYEIYVKYDLYLQSVHLSRPVASLPTTVLAPDGRITKSKTIAPHPADFSQYQNGTDEDSALSYLGHNKDRELNMRYLVQILMAQDGNTACEIHVHQRRFTLFRSALSTLNMSLPVDTKPYLHFAASHRRAVGQGSSSRQGCGKKKCNDETGDMHHIYWSLRSTNLSMTNFLLIYQTICSFPSPPPLSTPQPSQPLPHPHAPSHSPLRACFVGTLGAKMEGLPCFIFGFRAVAGFFSCLVIGLGLEMGLLFFFCFVLSWAENADVVTLFNIFSMEELFEDFGDQWRADHNREVRYSSYSYWKIAALRTVKQKYLYTLNV
ncbi:uncharacterized protein MYCFIDRAFT_176736 [Pseudocercospora fijiensis CIRAD86]|uniref:Uncharacterized protein n=1 Tax=Pseudocercospora fijiensis (strain CIRAD86) TaxID=383855 RepID=M2YUP0_PSEFD|nr:uncharacterized protein MYCFIDRAFT_176736 [Pseudocercospora fijiensis CIRAD86]EME81460.1 hypothetical protein MYCFIDRAFT_176736 [Pseudocercospora fijiensis CIRAD86]